MIKMYRALPKSDLAETKILRRQQSTRVPVNVPYLVDNLWEYLRPAHAPSRRHAIYASPSAEQALASASRGADNAVCEVVIHDAHCRIVQLSVPDAKEHKDIKTVMRVASALFAQLFNNMSDDHKLAYAPLFMPGTAAEQTAVLLRRPELQQLFDATNACTMWKDASHTVNPGHPGELFFELSANGAAILTRIDDAYYSST